MKPHVTRKSNGRGYGSTSQGTGDVGWTGIVVRVTEGFGVPRESDEAGRWVGGTGRVGNG